MMNTSFPLRRAGVMTTVREYLESGTREGYRLARKILKERYEQVPLCSVETKTRRSSLGHISTWVKCSWLKRWYTFKSFRKECLKCQLVMKERIFT